MPLTTKGKKIMKAMKSEYGPSRGKEVFYASKNKGVISGIDRGFYGHHHPEHVGTHRINTTAHLSGYKGAK